MYSVISVYKPIGKTPLECVRQYKLLHPHLQDITISYAGRLDPMAHGVLLLLIGEENKNREKYLSLNKTYKTTILFGITTDTYDVLGKVIKVSEVSKVSKEGTKNILEEFIGKREQAYPPYSSKHVKGKPLYKWSRDNRLNEIEIPKKEVIIFSIKVEDIKTIRGKELLSEIVKRIEDVSGDFRQKEIMDLWEKNIDTNMEFPLVSVVVQCSSGTYIRSLANALGEKLQSGAIAYDILRTKLGLFSIEDSEKIF